MKIKQFVLVIIISSLLASAPARAGGIGGDFATEMTQIANNIELAIQTMEEQTQSIQLIEQTYLSRLQQLQMTVGQYTAPFQRAMNAYNAIRNVQQTLSILQGRAEGLATALQYRSQQFGASNLTWSQWVSRERTLIQEGDQDARALIINNDQILQGVQDSMRMHQQAVEEYNSTPGVHAAQRLTGVSVNVMGQDVARLLSVTTEGRMIAEQKRTEELGKRREALQQLERTRNVARENEAATDSFIQGLRNFRGANTGAQQ